MALYEKKTFIIATGLAILYMGFLLFPSAAFAYDFVNYVNDYGKYDPSNFYVFPDCNGPCTLSIIPAKVGDFQICSNGYCEFMNAGITSFCVTDSTGTHCNASCGVLSYYGSAGLGTSSGTAPPAGQQLVCPTSTPTQINPAYVHVRLCDTGPCPLTIDHGDAVDAVSIVSYYYVKPPSCDRTVQGMTNDWVGQFIALPNYDIEKYINYGIGTYVDEIELIPETPQTTYKLRCASEGQSDAASYTVNWNLTPQLFANSPIWVNQSEPVSIQTNSGAYPVPNASVTLFGQTVYPFSMNVQFESYYQEQVFSTNIPTGPTGGVYPSPSYTNVPYSYQQDIAVKVPADGKSHIVYTGPENVTIASATTKNSNVKLTVAPSETEGTNNYVIWAKVTNSSLTYALNYDPCNSTLSTKTTTTDQAGKGSITFTAPSQPTFCRIQADASSPGYVSTGPASVDIQVVPVGTTILYDSLSANPSLVQPQQPTTLTGSITKYTGDPSDTINYNLWWDCSVAGNDVGIIEQQCGDLPGVSPGQCDENSNGAKCSALDGTTLSKDFIHAYNFIGTKTPKLIIERGSAIPPEASTNVFVGFNAQPTPTTTTTPTPTPLSSLSPSPTSLSCAPNPSSQIALVGQSKTFQVQSLGTGPFTWSIVSGDASTCTLTPNTDGTSVTVSCTTSGQRSLQCSSGGQAGSSPTATFTVFGEKVIEK